MTPANKNKIVLSSRAIARSNHVGGDCMDIRRLLKQQLQSHAKRAEVEGPLLEFSLRQRLKESHVSFCKKSSSLNEATALNPSAKQMISFTSKLRPWHGVFRSLREPREADFVIQRMRG